jgi:hypothetical protein
MFHGASFRSHQRCLSDDRGTITLMNCMTPINPLGLQAGLNLARLMTAIGWLLAGIAPTTLCASRSNTLRM